MYHKSLWEKLFSRYYHDRILEIVNHYPDKEYLIVDYDLIIRAWKSITKSDEAINHFILHPGIALQEANIALLEYILPTDSKNWINSGVKISGYPTTPIENLRSEHFGTLISVEGGIMERSNVIHRIKKAAFKCLRCEHVTYVLEPSGLYVEPFQCDNDVCFRKGPFELIIDKCTWEDVREIRILGTLPPKKDKEDYEIDAILINDVDCPNTEAKIKVTGILRGIPEINKKKKTTNFKKLIEINNIENTYDLK